MRFVSLSVVKASILDIDRAITEAHSYSAALSDEQDLSQALLRFQVKVLATAEAINAENLIDDLIREKRRYIDELKTKREEYEANAKQAKDKLDASCKLRLSN